MNAKAGIFSLVALCAATLSTAAQAHTGAGATTGALYGFLHPLGGIDHLLAMVAVGMFAFLLRGRALWLVPAAFVGTMAVGGIAGFAELQIPFVEAGIALSVIVIGGLVAAGRSLPLAAAMAVVGLFAVFHGHAHGTEMPETASGIAYGMGFMAATALLHAAGIALGYGAALLSDARLLRAGGAVVSLAGLAIVGGLI
ncbi:MAG: HupE/UreJ family protein [Rhodospirillaceae bacterium]